MSKNQYRIAVVGATNLLGKEIADEIADSPLATATTILLDNEEESGTLESMGDEASFVQSLEMGALENLDVAIFTDSRMLLEYGQAARQFGAAVVDATIQGAVEGNARVRSPLVGAAVPLGLEDSYVRSAHPVATMLAAMLPSLTEIAAVRFAAATILQPASENGRAAVDELQQQAINLLSFQSVPREEFDAQVAFNLLPALGESAKNPLDAVEQRITNDLRALCGETVLLPLIQVVQAPVFHGFTVSMFVKFDQPVSHEALMAALHSEMLNAGDEQSDPPTNLSSAGQGKILLRVKSPHQEKNSAFAIWMAADNLKLRARTAMACALELTRLRPLGKVQ